MPLDYQPPEDPDFLNFEAFATLTVSGEMVSCLSLRVEAPSPEWALQLAQRLIGDPLAPDFGVSIEVIEVEEQLDVNLELRQAIAQLQIRATEAERRLAELTMHLAARDPLFGAPEPPPPPSPGGES